MPDAHWWSGRTVAVFACTNCANEDFLIPKLLGGERKGADIPISFLTDGGPNYAFVTFASEAATIRAPYQPILEFHRWELIQPIRNNAASKIGGRPYWLMEDETPRSLDGKYEMVFLLQLARGTRFEMLAGPPPQIEFGYLAGKRGRPAKRGYYELFLGNALYLFGTIGLENELVYPIVQK